MAEGRDPLAERLMRLGFWPAVTALGFLVLIQAIWDPRALPVLLRSPLGAQSVFGLIIVVALLKRATSGCKRDRLRQAGSITDVLLQVSALALLCVLAYWRTTRLYFLSDDFVLVKVGNALRASYGTLFTPEAEYGFYRPVAKLSLALNAAWAGWDPFAWHLSALILHLTNSLLVFGLARRICFSGFGAFFAAALFSIHGTRPEAVAWIAGRFDLLATLFVISGMLFYAWSLEEPGAKRVFLRLLALMGMTLAILSKEAAYIFPLLLVLYLIMEPELLRRRVASVIPFFLIAGCLFAARWALLGGIGGYRDPHSGSAAVSTFDGFVALKALLLRIWAVLMFPVNWSVRPGIVFTLAMAACMICLTWLALTRTNGRRLAFSLGFQVVASLPAIHMLLIGSNMEKSRLLYLPSVGFCLMLASAVETMGRSTARLIAAVLIIFNLFALEHNLNAWEYASQKITSACAEAVRCVDSTTRNVVAVDPPPVVRGVYFLGNGLPECVEMQRKEIPSRLEIQHESGGKSAAADAACWLLWDSTLDEFRCVDRR